jgi:hypothetical protein
MPAATGELGRRFLLRGAIEPDAVAELTVTSLEDGPFLLLPHPEVAGCYAGRAADPDGWLAGTRRLSGSR